MTRLCTRAQVAAHLVCMAFVCAIAQAHGFVGERFFPPTISTDDPFAVDELALPTLFYVKNGPSEEGPGNHEFDAGFEFDKEILPHFAMGVSETYLTQKPDHGDSVKGWDNLTLTAKYEVWHSPMHEAIVAVGLEAEIGGTGSKSIGRSPYTTLSPTFFFGKGLGDLPDRFGAVRPFAITGTIAQTFPIGGDEPNALEWGIAVEYSLPYLQQRVRDVGLPAPFKDMTPIVEFAMSTGENRGERGLTTGTINPGVLWDTRQFQLGVEANIPVNSRSGSHVGVTLQMWIFIDDLFPKVFGHPIFGGDR